MGIFRHSTVFVNRMEFGDAALDSGSWAIRPADGDASSDDTQSWVLVAFVEQRGAGQVVFEFLTSFGDGLWIVLARRTLTVDGARIMMARNIDGFAPFIKVRVVASPPSGTIVKPTFRVITRIASDSPYRALPAMVPATIETDATDRDITNPPPSPGGA
jgi:hypothetical protein